MSMYASQLWNKFSISTLRRIRVAYNNSFRILNKLPRYVSARISLAINNLLTLDELLRKNYYSFMSRCFKSNNICLRRSMYSDCFFKSGYNRHCMEQLFAKNCTDASAVLYHLSDIS